MVTSAERRIRKEANSAGKLDQGPKAVNYQSSQATG